MNQLHLSVAVLGLAGLYAAWSDIRWRKLPNALCLALGVLGLAVAAYGGGLAPAASGLAHAVIALIVGIGLFALGVIGAGDAKYYAASATWFSLGTGLRLLLWVSLAGLALFFVWFVWRRLRGIKIRTGAADDSDKFPYGVAIAAGSVLTALAPVIRI
jgi:prepilin peptidase CpaA